jgi:hypothetical protein
MDCTDWLSLPALPCKIRISINSFQIEGVDRYSRTKVLGRSLRSLAGNCRNRFIVFASFRDFSPSFDFFPSFECGPALLFFHHGYHILFIHIYPLANSSACCDFLSLRAQLCLRRFAGVSRSTARRSPANLRSNWILLVNVYELTSHDLFWFLNN